ALCLHLFLSTLPPPPPSTPFPYTTLFRSRLANEKTTFSAAFAMADDVLYQGVKGVTDLMVRPGIINLDFADVRSVMDEMGKAMRSEEHTSELQSRENLVCRLLLEKKKKTR